MSAARSRLGPGVVLPRSPPSPSGPISCAPSAPRRRRPHAAAVAPTSPIPAASSAPSDAPSACSRSVLGADDFEAYRALGFLHAYGAPSATASRLRLPDLPAQADRHPTTAHRRAAERALRRVSRPQRAGARPAASRRRRRARQVDGAARRRARADRRRRTCTSRAASSIPTTSAATSCGSASGPAARRSRLERPRAMSEHDDRRAAPAPALGGRLRRARPRRRPRLHEGDRLRRRRAQAPDDRDRQHLDRGDALQLPPARSRRAHQGRASAPPAARRWSSTRSRSPTGSRWARRG